MSKDERKDDSLLPGEKEASVSGDSSTDSCGMKDDEGKTDSCDSSDELRGSGDMDLDTKDTDVHADGKAAVVRPTTNTVDDKKPAEKVSRTEESEDEERIKEMESIASNLSEQVEVIRDTRSDFDARETAVAVIQSALSGQIGSFGTNWCATHLKQIADAMITGMFYDRDNNVIYLLQSLLDFCHSMVCGCIKNRSFRLLPSLAGFLEWLFSKDTLEDVSVPTTDINDLSSKLSGKGSSGFARDVYFDKIAWKYLMNYYHSIGGFGELIKPVGGCNPDLTPADNLLNHDEVPLSFVSSLVHILHVPFLTETAIAFVVNCSQNYFVPYILQMTVKDVEAVQGKEDDYFWIFLKRNFDLHRMSHKKLDPKIEQRMSMAIFHFSELLLDLKPNGFRQAIDIINNVSIWVFNCMFGVKEDEKYYMMPYLSPDDVVSILYKMKYFDHLESFPFLDSEQSSAANDLACTFIHIALASPGEWSGILWRILTSPRSERDWDAMKDVLVQSIDFIHRIRKNHFKPYDWFFKRMKACPPTEFTPSVLQFLSVLASAEHTLVGQCLDGVSTLFFNTDIYNELSLDMRRAARRSAFTLMRYADEAMFSKTFALACDSKTPVPFRVLMLECSLRKPQFITSSVAHHASSSLFQLVSLMHNTQLQMIEAGASSPECNAEYERDFVMVLQCLEKNIIRPQKRFETEVIGTLSSIIFRKSVNEAELCIFLRWALSVVPYVSRTFTEAILERFATDVGTRATRPTLELFLSLFCALNDDHVHNVSWDSVSPFSVVSHHTIPSDLFGEKNLWHLLSSVPDEVFPVLRDFIVILFGTFDDVDSDVRVCEALNHLLSVLEGETAKSRFIQIMAGFVDMKNRASAPHLAASDESDKKDTVRVFAKMEDLLTIETSTSVSLKQFAVEVARKAESNGLKKSTPVNAVFFKDKLFRFSPVSDDDCMIIEENMHPERDLTLGSIGVHDLDIVTLICVGDAVYKEENNTILFDRKAQKQLTIEESRNAARDSDAAVPTQSSSSYPVDRDAFVLATLADVSVDGANNALDENQNNLDNALSSLSVVSSQGSKRYRCSSVPHNLATIVEGLNKPEIVDLLTQGALSSDDAVADAAWTVFRFLGVLPPDFSNIDLDVLSDPTECSDDQVIAAIKETERATASSKEFCETLMQSGLGENILCGIVAQDVIQRFITNISKSEKGEAACLQVYSVFLSICDHLAENNVPAEGEMESVFDSLFTFDAVFDVLCNSPVVLGDSDICQRIISQSVNLCFSPKNNRARVFVSSRISTLTGETPCSPAFREKVALAACEALFKGGDDATYVFSLLAKSFAKHDISGDLTISEAETVNFMKVITQRLFESGVPRYERTLLRVCLFNTLRLNKSLLSECILRTLSVEPPQNSTPKKEGRKTVAHPVLASNGKVHRVVDSVLQQLLLCRGVVESICNLDVRSVGSKRRPAISELKKVLLECVNGIDGFTCSSQQLMEEIEDYAADRKKDLSDPSNVWELFCSLFMIKSENAQRSLVSRIQTTLVSAKNGGVAENSKSVLFCKIGSDLEATLRASKPQLFTKVDSEHEISPVLNYPDQLMISIIDDYRACRIDDLVPKVRIPPSLTLGNGKKYVLTGLILSPKNKPDDFISCVRSFNSCHSDPTKTWTICGAAENRVIHASQSFVDQYLNGSVIPWEKAPVCSVVYTYLDDEDEVALGVNNTPSASDCQSNSSLTCCFDQRECELLLLFLLDDREAISELISHFSHFGDVLLSSYMCALGKQSEFAEVWSAFINDMLAKSSAASDSFLMKQVNRDGYPYDSCHMADFFVHCSSERIRILYEESIIVAIRRLELEQSAVLSKCGFRCANLDEMENLLGSCSIFRVIICALFLLEPVRMESVRIKQYFKLLLDIAQTSPIMEQILLALNIGYVLNCWFVNHGTIFGEFRQFVTADGLLPDLTEYVKLLEYLFKSDLARNNQDQACVRQYVHYVTDNVFITRLMCYPYAPSVIDSIITEFCHDSFDKSQMMWMVMKDGLEDRTKVDELMRLKKHILSFCGIMDSIANERIALVLGTNAALINQSLLSMWTRESPRDLPALSCALLFSGLCKVPITSQIISSNMRRYLWLEFASRSTAAYHCGKDFVTTYGVRDDDDYFEKTDEQIHGIGLPNYIKAYIVFRSACAHLQSLRQQSKPQQPISDDANYAAALTQFRELANAKQSSQQQNVSIPPAGLPSPDIPDFPEVPAASAAAASGGGKGKGKGKGKGRSNAEEEAFNQVKMVVGDDTFTDEQIRKALNYYFNNVDQAIGGLFDGRF